MDGEQIAALLGGVVVAAVIRVSNLVIAWLARVLKVEPPDAIPTPVSDRTHPPRDG